MKKSAFIIIFLLGLVVTLSLAKAIIHNRLSTSGVFISRIESGINSYKTENAILSEKLLTYSSLTNIASKALELGFAKEDSLMVLKASNSLAIKQ